MSSGSTVGTIEGIPSPTYHGGWDTVGRIIQAILDDGHVCKYCDVYIGRKNWNSLSPIGKKVDVCIGCQKCLESFGEDDENSFLPGVDIFSNPVSYSKMAKSIDKLPV